jgi:gas vesicle protein GvpG
MIILDTLLWGGLRFVLTKIVDAVDAEMNDEDRLREELLAAQMRVELGEMSEKDFAELESAILGRLREIREERMQGAPTTAGGEYKVTGIDAGIDAEVTWTEDDTDDRRRRRG